MVDRYTAIPCGCGCEIHHKAVQGAPKAEEAVTRAIYEWGKAALMEGIKLFAASGEINISQLNTEELRQLLRVGLSEAMEAGAKKLVSDVQMPNAQYLTRDQAQRFVETYDFNLVKGVTETMIEQLQTAIKDELDKGTTINQLAQNLTDTVDNVSLKRAEVIARSETARAAQYGAIQQAGIVGFNTKRYLVSGNPCGLCQAASELMDNKDVPLASPFFNAGDTIMGTDGKEYRLKYPIFAASDMHPNCGCATTFGFGD